MTMMTQEEFDFDGQRENLGRVSARIGGAIVEFCKHRNCGGRFHAQELHDFITQCVGVSAPGSADRVLRDLRKKGVIGYRVLSRSESLYEITQVPSKVRGRS